LGAAALIYRPSRGAVVGNGPVNMAGMICGFDDLSGRELAYEETPSRDHGRGHINP
jgi:hypothetical protein